MRLTDGEFPRLNYSRRPWFTRPQRSYREEKGHYDLSATKETPMEAWVVWLIIAGIFAVAEVLTLTFALGLFAVAAVAAGLTGAIGLPIGVQVIVFAATSGAGLAVIRPLVKRHVRHPPPLRSGVAALVGREGLALTEVTKHKGLVRIGGEEWTARPYDSSVVIPEGESVDVLAIEGATALVHPREEPLWTS